MDKIQYKLRGIDISMQSGRMTFIDFSMVVIHKAGDYPEILDKIKSMVGHPVSIEPIKDENEEES